MTLKKFWTVVVKQWKLIITCFVVVSIGAYIGSRLMTPLYQSSVLVEVAIRSNSNQTDYNSLLASDQLVPTEAKLAVSSPVLTEVASHYPDMTAEKVAKEATATSMLNTQLFEIDVLDPSPMRAAELANDIAMTLIKQQLQGTNFLRIVQAASPGLSPVQPNVLLVTSGGLVAGLFLGILLALLFEQLDTRIRTPEAITELLNWPTLATVHLAKSLNREEMINPGGRDINVESYRILRTNLGFASLDRPLHSLLVTSALPRDGKSVIAANLAIFMARAGKQTLIIDADLRRPTQHILFNLPAEKMGLSNAVLAFSSPGMNVAQESDDPHFHNPALGPLDSVTTESLSLRPFVHSVGIPNLRVMPTGPLPPNPSELLDSKAMHRFLAVIENCGVEMVIFDAPPLLGLPDASILASKVDGAIAVIDMTRAAKGKLAQLKAVLGQAGIHVLGCVANKHRYSRDDAAYSYYQVDEQKRGPARGRKGRISPFPLARSHKGGIEK